MEILKFNVFNFLNKSKKTTVPLVLLCPTFPYHEELFLLAKLCKRSLSLNLLHEPTMRKSKEKKIRKKNVSCCAIHFLLMQGRSARYVGASCLISAQPPKSVSSKQRTVTYILITCMTQHWKSREFPPAITIRAATSWYFRGGKIVATCCYTILRRQNGCDLSL